MAVLDFRDSAVFTGNARILLLEELGRQFEPMRCGGALSASAGHGFAGPPNQQANPYHADNTGNGSAQTGLL